MSYDHVTVVNRYPILQLSIDHYMDGCYQVKHRLQAPTLARKFDILHWLSWVRMDRRTDVQSCVIHKFEGKGHGKLTHYFLGIKYLRNPIPKKIW